MKVIGFLAVSALGALAASPEETLTLTSSTYKWMEDKTYDGDSEFFWKSGAGNTGLDCANRCESMVGCVGFSLQYEDIDSYKASECKGFMAKDGGDGIMDRPSYLKGKKFGFYSRDGELAVTVAAAITSFKGTNLADTVIPDGYAGIDHINCQSKEGGEGAFKDDKMHMGGNTKPGIAKCAELCNSLTGCQAFSMVLGGTYADMCVAYSGQTVGGNAYGCNIETGKDTEAVFVRLAGKVTEPACAPDGTDNKRFKICGAAGDFSGAPVTSASVFALLLAPLVAVLLA